MALTEEHVRLDSDGYNWKRWGPYLSERAWGTVREDYSDDGNAWMYFPHDQARSRTYRWSEDGLGVLVTRSKYSVLLWLSGTGKTLSSKSDSSAWQVRRAIMVRTSRSITSILTLLRPTPI